MRNTNALLAVRVARAFAMALLLVSSRPAAAWDDSPCPGIGPTGSAMANDNGLTAPFNHPCQAAPIIHAYACTTSLPGLDYIGTKQLFLGDPCPGTPGAPCLCDTVTCVPKCGSQGWGEPLSKVRNCGGPAADDAGALPDNGLVPVLAGPGQVRFSVHYTATQAYLPWVRLVLAKAGVIVSFEQTDLLPGTNVIELGGAFQLSPGIWDVQLTLADHADCVPYIEGQQLYFGGETENYWLCVNHGDCAGTISLTSLRPLR